MPNDDINLDQIQIWMSDRNIWRKKIQDIAKTEHQKYLELQPHIQIKRKDLTTKNEKRIMNLKISAYFAILKYRCFTNPPRRKLRKHIDVPAHITTNNRLCFLSTADINILHNSGWHSP